MAVGGPVVVDPGAGVSHSRAPRSATCPAWSPSAPRTPGNSRGNHAPHAHTTRSAPSSSPPTFTAPPYGTARPKTRRTPASTARPAVTWRHGGPEHPGARLPEREREVVAAEVGEDRPARSGSQMSCGISRFFRTWALCRSHPSGRRANHTAPDSPYSSSPARSPSSRHSSLARHASRAYHSSAPCAHRSNRVSPALACRRCPGWYCSTSVTRQPDSASRAQATSPDARSHDDGGLHAHLPLKSISTVSHHRLPQAPR